MTRQVATVEVLLLTQEHCSLCEHAKHVLDRLATEHPLRITVVDLLLLRAALWPPTAESCSRPGSSWTASRSPTGGYPNESSAASSTGDASQPGPEP